MKFNQNTTKILVKDQFIPNVSSKDLYFYYGLFLPVLSMTSHPSLNIEIINNTRGGIEGEIWERDDWGTNSCPGCSLFHDVPGKKSQPF